MDKKILVLQGPNLNLLGKREPEIYGTTTLEDIHQEMIEAANNYSIELEFFQSNHEGELIDKIHNAFEKCAGIIINPGAFTHYSYAISDAISAVQIPTVEIHISNIYNREQFRQKSVVAPVCIGQISGLGIFGYIAAINFFANYLKSK